MGARTQIALSVLACLAMVFFAVRGDAAPREQARSTQIPVLARALGSATPTATATPVRVKVAVTPAPRPAASKAPVDLRTKTFATVGGISLDHPSPLVERIGFHQASDVHDVVMSIAPTATRPVVMGSRGRGTASRTAADAIVPPTATIYAPVTGIVRRAKGYHLYCKYADSFLTISPVGHPELEVKMLHISGLLVRPGDHVVAGKTAVAAHATKFPFVSEVDVYSAHSWPHVHMEVTRLAVPSAKPEPGVGLSMGCA